MKKTQSLKLMLLGLMASVSSSVWAQYTAKNGVVYDVSGTNATVVGVLSNLPDGKFGQGRYADGTKSIQIEDVIDGKQVTGFANNWKAAGQFANTPDGSIPTPTTTPTENADGSVTYTYNQGGGSQTTKVFNTQNISELANVELVFKATGITEISRSDIDGINVAGFILGGNSGITEIPENLFSGVSVTKVIDQERLDKIAYYQSLIGNSPTWIIEDGVYTSEGKFKGNQVYRVNRINAFSNVAPLETTYVVVDMDFAQKGANWDNDNILVHPAYALSNDGKYTPETEAFWTNVSVSDDGKTLYQWRPAFGGNGRWVEVATAIDWNLGEGEADGLQAIWEKKDAKAKELKGIYDQKSIERSDAEYAKNHIDDTNEKRAEASAKAKALKDAIEAFGSDNAKWTILKGKLQEYFTNVTNVSYWFAAFTLSTADEALLTAAGINKSEWQNEIDAFIPAYTDFYGTAPAALIEYTVHGYAFKSYGATGDIFSHGETSTPVVASSENFQFYANGVVEDCSSVVGDPDATVKIGDKMYFKVKVLQNDIEGFKDNYYYVQTDVDANNKPVVNFNSTYYVLYEYKAQPAQLAASFDGSTRTITTTLNGASAWTANYSSRSDATLTFPDESTQNLIIFTISEGTHAGNYAISDYKLYSVDASNNATPVMGTPETKEMIPVTFTPDNISSTPGTPASDEMTQLIATLNGAGNMLIATFPGEQTTRLTLKVAEKPDVEDNSFVEVGDKLSPVSTCYRVNEEGEAWNGYYFTDDAGNLYKHVSGATWTTITDPSGRKIAATKVEMNKHTDAVPGTPEVIGQNTTLVVMITKTEDYTYTLTPATAQAAIDSHNPDVDYNPVLENNKPLKKQDLDEAYRNAVAAENAAKSAWEIAAGEAQTAKDNLDAAQGQLDHWTDEVPEYKDEFVYEDGVKNETLLFVAFNNDVVSVGAHAFAQCEKAKFTGTFKSKLVKIGKEAFLNTLFANLNLSNTGKIDWRGGEPDEDGNPTPDGKIDIEDRLTGSDIAQDAFVGTPLETMKLDATNLGDGWVYNVTRNIKFKDVVYTYDCNQKETRNVNTTLKTVTLPTGEGEDEELEFDRVQQGTFANCVALEAITIPGQVYQIEADAFNGCDKLATITFATVKPELQRIGARAFQGTAAESINLSNQVLLGIESIAILPPSFSYAEQAWNMPVGIGDYAFAGMPNLKDVNITNTQLTTLPQNVFFGSTNLQGVTFFAADPKSESTIETLPAGLFRTNFEITALDLSRTQITVLQNLFQARPEKENILDCDGNKIGEKGLWNEKLATFTLPENLEEIKPFALSSLWGLTYSKADPFIIPGTVEDLGEGVFYNDKNLVAVKAMDSELTYLPERTFAQCTNLEEVTLVTFETLMPDAFGDKCFFSTKTPDVYVNNDTYELLGANFFEGSYATLKPYASTIQTIQLGNLYFKPWTSKYGAWIEATNNVGVYTAYQNGSKISLYPAKKSTFVGKDGVRRDYYKIAAYDKDADPFEEIIPGSRPGSEPTIKEWSAPAQIDYLLTSRMTFNRSGQYGEGISPIWVDGEPTMPMLEYSDNFSDEVLEKTWLALGTAIIVSNQPDDIPYIQKTNAWQKYQSTLDLANQLCVAKEDIPADNNTNFYFLAEQDGTYKFIHHNDETAVPFIPENAVIFMQDPVYGHLGLARDFDIEFVGEGEATAINGVVERSLNDSEAIFNVQGVRVIAPVKGQMYIQGGKKFIQK